MPEEAIETQEIKESVEEAAEHAHGAHRGAQWLTWLSLSTAIIAVLAAIAALESGSYANEAIVQKNDAVLHQSKADDAWAYYHAKGLEAALYSTQAEAASRPEAGARWRALSEHETQKREAIRREAETEEKAVSEMDSEAGHSLRVHHEFAKSVTIFQVAIALAAIAALTRRQPMWWISLVIGAVGIAFFVSGFVASARQAERVELGSAQRSLASLTTGK
jgi:aminopeptidase N